MLNKWSANKDAIALWFIKFPVISGQDDIQRLFTFVDWLLELGETEEVYRLVNTGGANPYRSDSGIRYSEFLKRELERTGRIPLFWGDRFIAENRDDRLRTPGKICYYDTQGKVIEREIEDMGILLQELRPDRIAPENMRHMFGVAPVAIEGFEVHLDESIPDMSRRPTVIVGTHTDIWFPKVRGYLEAEPDASRKDNQVLAQCHTPRFNRFLQKVHELALEMGAEWKLDLEECHPFYRDLITETGIRLDV